MKIVISFYAFRYIMDQYEYCLRNKAVVPCPWISPSLDDAPRWVALLYFQEVVR